jgi:hypothetical protein
MKHLALLALLNNNQELVTMPSGGIVGSARDEIGPNSCNENIIKGNFVTQFLDNVLN